jgi:hypothetical protein
VLKKLKYLAEGVPEPAPPKESGVPTPFGDKLGRALQTREDQVGDA